MATHVAGVCGDDDRLHGFCDEVEGPDSDHPIHRTCPTCAATKADAGDASSWSKRMPDDGPGDGAGQEKRQKSTGGKPRTRLNLGQKLEILELLKDKVPYAEIGQTYKCSKRTVGLIAQSRVRLENELASAGRATKSKTSRRGDFPEVDNLVMSFVKGAKEHGMPVTRASVRSYGRAAKESLLETPATTDADKKKLEGFGASEKWARNFIVRNGLSNTAPKAEARNEAVEAGMAEIRKECGKYLLENIFSVGQTGLFYKLLPKRSYLSDSETRKTARGAKNMGAEDHVSAYLCTNATGSAKTPMALIGKPKNPPSFGRKDPPLKYFSQANAWSDGWTFRRWWLEVFLPFVRRWTRLEVLCLVDGCSSHDLLEDPEGQVKVMAYPPNCATKHQPMDVGIIAATKLRYRTRLLNVRVSTMGLVETLRAQANGRKMAAGTAGLAEGHDAHILDAAEILQAAWEDVTATSIARCWAKAETLPATQQADLVRGSAKGAKRGSKEPGVAELIGTLNALSVGVKQASPAPGVEDDAELCQVIADLGIAPGKRAGKAAIGKAKAWVGLEEVEEIAEALILDRQDVLVEEMGSTVVGGVDPSDDEQDMEPDAAGAGEGEGSKMQPPYAQLALQFGSLEYFAEAAGNDEAAYHLRKARMSFITASASKEPR